MTDENFEEDLFADLYVKTSLDRAKSLRNILDSNK
jgi:hypothetical protein